MPEAMIFWRPVPGRTGRDTDRTTGSQPLPGTDIPRHAHHVPAAPRLGLPSEMELIPGRFPSRREALRTNNLYKSTLGHLSVVGTAALTRFPGRRQYAALES